ncbi:uncharacterized protein LOC131830235 [Mustela lutreola]|uniref:uncharacterized protein LOC131830235 n=1 Tax=Mustela lutreola TaxID=9666 RepID=UPI0027973C77|nr:uncharacterized protein LOC131830235 [Mustela lutreola]
MAVTGARGGPAPFRNRGPVRAARSRRAARPRRRRRRAASQLTSSRGCLPRRLCAPAAAGVAAQRSALPSVRRPRWAPNRAEAAPSAFLSLASEPGNLPVFRSPSSRSPFPPIPACRLQPERPRGCPSSLPGGPNQRKVSKLLTGTLVRGGPSGRALAASYKRTRQVQEGASVTDPSGSLFRQEGRHRHGPHVEEAGCRVRQRAQRAPPTRSLLILNSCSAPGTVRSEQPPSVLLPEVTVLSFVGLTCGVATACGP